MDRTETLLRRAAYLDRLEEQLSKEEFEARYPGCGLCCDTGMIGDHICDCQIGRSTE